MEPLVCQRCQIAQRPGIHPGTGPHAAKAVCPTCGLFIKWLPKAKGPSMASVNRVVLVGAITERGVEVSFVGDGGTAKASFAIQVTESREGRDYKTLVPCNVWGKNAEAAGEIEAGQMVVLEGKLRSEKKADQTWQMVVSGFELLPLTGKPSPPAPARPRQEVCL